MSSEKEKGEYDPNKKYRDFKWEKPDEFKNGPLGDDKRLKIMQIIQAMME